jgi:hypothetical protein
MEHYRIYPIGADGVIVQGAIRSSATLTMTQFSWPRNKSARTPSSRCGAARGGFAE